MNAWRRWLFLVALCAPGALVAQTTTLLPFGSMWRYRDDGTDQGTAWRQVGFADAGWAAGVGQLGYGDGDEATVTGFIDVDPVTAGVQRNATTYFRTTVNVPSPGQFTALNLTLLHDDAGAVYLNGVEVARTPNLPAGAAYDTYATALSAENATQTWTLSPSALNAGPNTIAVEVHQQSASSSDLSFDLQLAGVSAVTRGPYLQMNRATGVTIRWRTATPSDSVVWTGPAPGALAVAATEASVVTDHEVVLSGLSPDARYFYAVGSSAGVLAGGDPEHFFKSAPVAGTDRPTRIWVLGDAGTANNNQRAVRDAYLGSSEYQFNDLVLLLGDNAYNTGTDTEYQAALFDMYPAVLRQSPVWSCLGNHETAQATGGSYGGAPYFDIFSFPTAAQCGGYASGTERYFSWDFGNIHFISLDAQTTNATLRANMLAWLENDLLANTRRWTIALWHHPPYTKGSHNSDTEAQLIWTRENLVPRLEAAGVDLVLSGHSHSYERSKFIDGFTATPTLAASGTFVDAGDGRPAGNGAYGKDYGAHRGAVYAVPGSSGQISGGTLNHPVMFTSLNVLGSLVLDVVGNRLDAKFINSAGVVADRFSIEKGPLVTVTAPVPGAAEYGPVVGQFSVARSGSTASPLVVGATVGGSAAGTRYAPLAVPVTIPAGAASQAVAVVPQPDAISQGGQTVTLTGAPGVAYRLGAATPATVTIADTPPGAPAIAAWHLAKFGAAANNPAISGDTADPDGDGTRNLLEYALGLEPLAGSSSGLPAVSTAGNFLVLTATRNPAATDVTFRIEVSGDLANPLGWSSAPTTILQDTPGVLQARDNVPLGSAPRRFIRLLVTRP